MSTNIISPIISPFLKKRRGGKEGRERDREEKEGEEKMSDSEAIYSSSEEAQTLLAKEPKVAVGETLGKRKRKPRKPISAQLFWNEVKRKHNVELVAAEGAGMASGGRRQSKCKLCGVIKPNKADRWKDHTQKCQGLKHLAERRNLGAFVSASGEKHRQMLVDTYLLTYFVYKERYAFTLPAKLKEVGDCGWGIVARPL